MYSVLHYVLGLDIGIQSVGWAVIRCEAPFRIEDFGVRMFDTTENPKAKDNANQERRAFRATRRVIRRRSHRKAMLKVQLQRMGLLRPGEVEAFFENGNVDLLRLRVKGLTERLTPVELAACLINLSNHRGYKDFYSLNEEEQKQLTKEEQKEYIQERSGIERVKEIMERGNYRSVAEMLLNDCAFAPENGGTMRVYRSHPYLDVRYPISREQLLAEAGKILECQSKFYPCLNQPYNTYWRKKAVTATNREFLLWLLFEQRDFEDGPGDADDELRKYTGFLMSLGHCPFYREELRGSRMSVLGDLYAVTNALSQYRYQDQVTGQFVLPKAMAKELLDATLKMAALPQKEIKAIAKKYHIAVDDKDTKAADRAPNCVKFMRRVKPILEQCGIDWQIALGEDPLAEDTFINQVGRVLSLYQTPRRRKQELMQIPGMTQELATRLTAQKLSGTAKVSNRYMRDAIMAFANGERYGEFQWRIRNELEQPLPGQAAGQHKKLPPFPADAEFAKNSVVMRSLNETRKVINAIVEKYGSPWAVNVEVASELGRSWAERAELQRQNRQNQEKADQEKKDICTIMGWDSADRVTGAMLERYRLAVQQDWKCLYTGKAFLSKSAVIDPHNKAVEVDHIVPFSLILDNTLNNKALVFSDANQTKGQRTPLMYLQAQDRRQEFVARVNQMAKDRRISDRKRQYLLLPDLRNQELLNEWKTRNLNDTRYIAKYLRGYLERELASAPEHRTPFVFPVKGGLTSRFRKVWLNRKSWGLDDKDQLRKQTTLHHAVDAVVIANITPATAQIAEDNMRLNRILKASHGVATTEYMQMLEKSLQTLQDYYHIPRGLAEKYLKRQDRMTALLPDLNVEVEVRFGVPGQDFNQEDYRKKVMACYADDPEFAESCLPPLTSRKPERKLQGEVTSGNPLGARWIDGKLVEMKRVDVLSLTRSLLEKLVTNDGDLRDSLMAWLEQPHQDAAASEQTEGQSAAKVKGEDKKEENKKKEKELTLGELLSKQGKTEFRTQKGRLIRKVTLQGNVLDTARSKQIGPNNHSILDATKYYCVEVYRNKQGETKVRGIARIDVVRRDKKLWLACPQPEDYAEHILYLFKNDYITVESKNGLQFEGYYQSPAGLKQCKFTGICKNAVAGTPFHISSTAQVKKYAVDILGRKGGEIGCGEPLSLLQGKK